MLYEYSCPVHGQFDLVEPVDQQHELAVCPQCSTESPRVWSIASAYVYNMEPHYNHGLGCRVTSRSDIREAQRRYNGQTGGNLIEMGNDTSWRAQQVRSSYPSANEIGY